jgi:hypothetical protein
VWDGLEPLERDHLATGLARPVGAGIQPRQSVLDVVEGFARERSRDLGVLIGRGRVECDPQLHEARRLVVAARQEQSVELLDGVTIQAVPANVSVSSDVGNGGHHTLLG